MLGFGIAASTLLFSQFGLKTPVTHHMALPAAAAALASGDFLTGAAFGVVGGLAGEGFSRVFHQHGDTHVDPPAAGIAITIALIRALWPAPL